MSQNERLREALLEIEVLRKRERESLRETQALLDILKLTTGGDEPRETLRAALRKIAEVLSADCVAIASLNSDSVEIELATLAGMDGEGISLDAAFFSRKRNIVDIDRVSKLKGLNASGLGPFRSLISAPDISDHGPSRVLLCLDQAPRKFSNQNLDFLERALQLVSQSLRNLALSTQNSLLAAVIDGSSSGFAIADALDDQMPLVFVNKAFEELTGYSAQEAVGQNCRFLSTEPHDSPERTRLRNAVNTRSAGRFLLRNIRKDGSAFWNDLALFPVLGSDGSVHQLVATQTDATERVAAEEQSKIAKTRLQNVLDHTRDAFLMILDSDEVAFANDGTRQMFPAGDFDWQVGTSFQANWGQYVSRLSRSVSQVPAELSKPDLKDLCKQTEGIRVGLPDGRQVLFRAQATSEGAIVVSATDTTAIRNTERLLRQRVAAVENATDGIGILDSDGRVTYSNSALGRLLGYEIEGMLLGRKWAAHYETPENADQLRAEVGLSDGSQIYLRKSKDESQTYHEVTLTSVDSIGDVLVVRDVTTALQNRHRLGELNKQIEDARRREAISTLAAGLAHDFNNVLSAIGGSAMLIATDEHVPAGIKEHANRISKAGASAARLVNRMLDLGAADDDASIFDVRSVMGEVRALVEANLSADTDLLVHSGEDALNVRADVADITLVLLNLVLNANDALIEARGRIDVRLTQARPDPQREPLLGRPIADKRYARISVSDTGRGIAPDVMPKILDSFFTTKGSRGTGAGLAMVAAIINRLGGLIYVESTIGSGTTFDVLIPLLADVAGQDAENFELANLSGKAILILDDQREVANVTAAFLEKCGAEVSVLEDPQLAVETILEDPDDWAALVTDYDMPVMSGGDVVEKISAQTQNFPIFVVTALARRLSDPRITDATVQAVFAKPTNLGQLAQALENLDTSP